MRWLLAILALFLVSCDEKKPRDVTGNKWQTGVDGYYLEDTHHKIHPEIVLVIHNSQSEMVAAFPASEGRAPRNMQAFSRITKDGSKCTIHIVDPRRGYKPQFYGHELTHCLYVRWHPTQGER